MRLHRDERGQAVLLVALSLPLMLGFVGIATDVGTLFKDKRDIQTAADAAAIAGALNIATNTAQSAATTVATHYGYTEGVNGVHVSVPATPQWQHSSYQGLSGYVEVTISKPEPTIFLSIFGYPSVTVLARAVATNQASGNGCVYTLGTTGTDLYVQGSPGITAPDCAFNIASQDTNGDAVEEVGKGGTIQTASVGVVGTLSSGNKPYADFQPPPTGGVIATSDPLSGQEYPYTCSASGCTCPSSSSLCANNPVNLTTTTPNYQQCVSPNILSKGTTVLNPGCYDLGGGTTIGSQATVSLSSANGGVYFFTNGILTLQAGATLTGVGVTLIFTGNSSINMTGTPNLNLQAPDYTNNPTGSFQNLLYYQVPDDTTPLNLQGGATTTLHGIFYAPTASVTLQGTPGGSIYTDFVVKTLTLAGNSSFNSYASLPGGASSGLHAVALVE